MDKQLWYISPVQFIPHLKIQTTAELFFFLIYVLQNVTKRRCFVQDIHLILFLGLLFPIHF